LLNCDSTTTQNLVTPSSTPSLPKATTQNPTTPRSTPSLPKATTQNPTTPRSAQEDPKITAQNPPSAQPPVKSDENPQLVASNQLSGNQNHPVCVIVKDISKKFHLDLQVIR
jgi:hypothetical protein